MGIFEAELQYWDQLDLDLFFTNFTHWIPNGTHPVDNNVDGGVAQTANVSEAGGESMLDLEVSKPYFTMTADVKAERYDSLRTPSYILRRSRSGMWTTFITRPGRMIRIPGASTRCSTPLMDRTAPTQRMERLVTWYDIWTISGF